MFKRKILFFIVFLTLLLLSSCSLRKNDTKINQIKNQKTPERQKSSTVIEGQEIETLGKELNIDETTFKQNNSI